MTYAEFRHARYFPALDGLRAISVLLVLSFHTGDSIWSRLHGYLGVSVFFVLSGFLITTLLLREEDTFGRVSIWRFCIRRAFRIFPLYFLALLVVCVLTLGFGLGTNPAAFLQHLWLFATFNGEFAGGGTFGHSWSLGIEEKFYLIWPILGFALIHVASHRLTAAVALLALSAGAASFEGWDYFAIYFPILAGVTVACLAHQPKTFAALRLISNPWLALPLLALTVWTMGVNDESTYVHVPFGALIALCLPVFMLKAPGVGWILRLRVLRFVGRRAYAIYLFHPMVLNVVNRVVPTESGIPTQVIRFVLLAGISILIAEILFRLVEAPFIRIGRSVANRSRAKDTAGAASISADTRE